MPGILTSEEKQILLSEARQAITLYMNRQPLLPLDLSKYSLHLVENGASFVTLTIHGDLRGCIGTLEAYRPLIEDVRSHAIDAGFHDYRFPPLRPFELDHVRIEVSYLSSPRLLEYSGSNELCMKLRPGIDGVILQDGVRRATFLPQVWEKLPTPELFLSYLCEKMGSPSDLWEKKKLEVSTYEVEEFHEE